MSPRTWLRTSGGRSHLRIPPQGGGEARLPPRRSAPAASIPHPPLEVITEVALAVDYVRLASFVPAWQQLDDDRGEGRIDIGCIADAGTLVFNVQPGYYEFSTSEKAATMFLFELIAQLQAIATVPMIDVRAYANWLS